MDGNPSNTNETVEGGGVEIDDSRIILTVGTSYLIAHLLNLLYNIPLKNTARKVPFGWVTRRCSKMLHIDSSGRLIETVYLSKIQLKIEIEAVSWYCD